MDNKRYEKALNLYNKGNIEKAIKICDTEISEDLSNSNIINLKGLILYLKGELESSISLWNINIEYNNDQISNSYLNDAKKDFKRKELYEEAELLIQNLNIDEAINILKICSESDFNSINVNNALAICYLKKGDYDSAKKHLEKVLKIDRNNDLAKKNNKELKTISKYNNKSSFNRILIIILSGIFILLIIFGIKFIFKYNSKDVDLPEEVNNIEEYYYRAVLLYKNKDLEVSKSYANKILINYPHSIYNNSYIKEILNS